MPTYKPLVSVIMGIYNCASTLQEALDSLYAQSFQDYEIILCDDGSTDNTLNIALQNQNEHSHIVVLQNEHNMGLNFTLNRCLEVAQGKYIARMDGDDISLPIRFEKQVDFLNRHSEIAIVSSVMIFFDEKGDFKQSCLDEYPTPKSFKKSCVFSHAAAMVRKNAFDEVQGYSVDKKFLRVEDYHLWFRMYAKGFRGYNFQEPLYKMRDDRNAYSRRKYQFRLNEAYVRYLCYKKLDVPWYYRFYIIKPLIIGMLPAFLYRFLHKYFSK